MQARAQQLGARLVAGPEDGEWVVDVRIGPESRTASAPDLPGAVVERTSTVHHGLCPSCAR